MKTMIAVVALSLMAGAAVAGEGNGDPFPYSAQPRSITLQNYQQAKGSDQNPYPFTASPTPMVVGQVLPTDGAQGVVQTANSLPDGFSDANPSLNTRAATPNTRVAQPVPTSNTHG